MKRNFVLLLLMLFAFTVNGFSQSNQAAQPTVMVIPDINSKLNAKPEQLRDYMESNPLLELCIRRVKEAFTLKGYPVRDFAKALAAMKTDALISADQDAAADIAKQIVQASDADICIYVKPQVINHEGGMSEVLIGLDAQEAKLSDSFANASFSSDKFRTNDSIKLATRALDCISNNFFFQIEEGFHKMVVDGRTMRFKIEFVQGCAADAYAEVGANGNDMVGELDEWAAKQGGKVTGSSDKVISVQIKVPVYDTDGSAFPIGRKRSELQRSLNGWLKPLGCRAKTILSRDQVINFMVSNLED